MRRRVLLAVGVGVAAIIAVLSVYRIDGFGLTPRNGVHHSTATTEILVDSQPSALADLSAPSSTLTGLAQTLANFAPNHDVLNLIGHYAGLEGAQIYAQGPAQPNLPRAVLEPSALQRNLEIAGEKVPFRLQFNQNPLIPAIGVYAQAPTTAQAVRLANATFYGLRDYLKQLEASGDVRPNRQVILRQLGAAIGSPDSPSAAKALALLAFIGSFVAWCVLILAGERLADSWRASRDRVPSGPPEIGAESAEGGSYDPRLEPPNGFSEEQGPARVAAAISESTRDDAR